MKVRYTLLACLFFVLTTVTGLCQKSWHNKKHYQAQAIPDTNNVRSDTINVLQYTINLNIIDTLNGNTVVRFTPKMNNINTLCLDLLKLNIDSIDINNAQVTYTYNDTIITVVLPATMNMGDTSDVTVYYHGKPQVDQTGWGGFYFTAPYAYNLGVGFGAVPHNYGRTWFPCFDNFVSRSRYIFNITSDSADFAYCNGYLAKDTLANGKRTRTWVMDSTIPTYLACVAVAPYTQILDTFRGIDTIPIVIAGRYVDTANIRKSFVHLKNAISIYQNCFGKYMWNKVGYSMVPFSSGAMEHATNIAFPVLAANGTTAYEADIMAHELSHHWFGDLVTCRTAGDMWLNEGFATYCQYIFLEYLYGEGQYHSNVRTNHESVLHEANLVDHSYLALHNMPMAYTYGYTTYQKGADVLHTLRGYLGDSNFFNGLKYYLHTHLFQAVNSDTLMNSLQRYSGIPLSDFFSGWVNSPGFPHFSIDSMTVSPSGPNYSVTVYVRQRLTHAPTYFNNVPLEITFKAADWTEYSQTISVSGHLSAFTFTVPIKPVFAALNVNEKISEAIAPDTLVVNKTGTYNLTNSRFDITVTSIADSAFLYFEHNFTAPDKVKDTSLHYYISPNRYWKFSGVFPSNFKATAKLYYDGRKVVNSYGGYLDTALTIHTRDSIILLYRQNTASDWQEFPYYTKHNIGVSSNMYGYMQLDSVFPGEYTFANGVSHVLGVQENKQEKIEMEVFPNPASGNFTVKVSSLKTKESIKVYDVQGKMVKQVTINPGQKDCVIKTRDWNSGTYIVSLSDGNKNLATRQVVITH